MGDTAQLPPVGEEQSPALFADALKGYGLEVQEVDLTQVVRQEQQSGILWNATRLRQLITEDACEALPKIKVAGFADIKVLPGDELIDALETCYDRDGLDETIVICRSNKRANIYNNGIRSRILWREDELNTGDLLMVAKIIITGRKTEGDGLYSQRRDSGGAPRAPHPRTVWFPFCGCHTGISRLQQLRTGSKSSAGYIAQ